MAERTGRTPRGLMRYRSAYGMDETKDRLRAAVAAHGMVVLAEIDHAAGAAQAGLSMQPMVTVAFGNATAGTPLMQAAPTIGIDLPLRALVWMDEDVVWLAANDPAVIAERHGALIGHEPIVAAMQRALDAVVVAATTR